MNYGTIHSLSLFFDFSYNIWVERATSFATLIGSGIEPCNVKELSIVIACFNVKPQYRIKRNFQVFNNTRSRLPNLPYCSSFDSGLSGK